MSGHRSADASQGVAASTCTGCPAVGTSPRRCSMTSRASAERSINRESSDALRRLSAMTRNTVSASVSPWPQR